MQKKIILWERGNDRRGRSFIKFREQNAFFFSSEWHLIWDSDSTNIVTSKHWDTSTDLKRSVLIAHLSNLLSPGDVLKSVEAFNRKYPKTPVILYSGGMEAVEPLGRKIKLYTDMGTFDFVPQFPDSVCVFPKKVKDDIVKSLHLDKALKIFAKKYSASDFFKAVLLQNPPLEIFLQMADNLSFPKSLKDRRILESTKEQLNTLRNLKEFIETDINYLSGILDRIKQNPILADEESTYLQIRNALNKLSTKLLF